MSSVASDLLALARALRAGQVTPAEAADRLLILAHRAHVSAAQAGILPRARRYPRCPHRATREREQ
jgi:hypothetical protein